MITLCVLLLKSLVAYAASCPSMLVPNCGKLASACENAYQKHPGGNSAYYRCMREIMSGDCSIDWAHRCDKVEEESIQKV